MGVWAVNYATLADWECMRDDGRDGMDEMAQVVCLPQLFATAKEALDAGEASWRNDQDYEEDDVEERNRIAGLRAEDTDTTTRVLLDDDNVEVVIHVRELKLPDVYEG